MVYRNIQEAQGALIEAQRSLAEATAALEANQAYLEAAQEAQRIIQALAAETQAEVTNSLAALVSKCLVAVFGPEAYQLDIQLSVKRGRTDVAINLKDPLNGELLDPMSATGGGVVDVAAFALRVAAVLLHRPRARRLIVLDEPFKFLSSDLRLAARDLLTSLAEELQFQFIVVTHLPELTLPGSVDLGVEG